MQFSPLQLTVTHLQVQEFDEIMDQVVERTVKGAWERAERLGWQDATARFRDHITRCLVISMTRDYKPFFGTRLGFNPEEVRIDITPIPHLLVKTIPHLERYDEYQEVRLKGGRYFCDSTGVSKKDDARNLITIVTWRLPKPSKYL